MTDWLTDKKNIHNPKKLMLPKNKRNSFYPKKFILPQEKRYQGEKRSVKDHFAPKRQKKINITPTKKIWRVKDVSGSSFYPSFNNITPDDPYTKEEKIILPQKIRKMPHVQNNRKKFKKRVIRMENAPNKKDYPGKNRGIEDLKGKARKKRWKRMEMTRNVRED
jgi:hypothetical protein